MIFEWDEHKNRINKRLHGVSFELAIHAFYDPDRIERYDAVHSTLNEERRIIIERVKEMLILFVSYTDRNGHTRIISARKAEPDEEAEYYDNFYYK